MRRFCLRTSAAVTTTDQSVEMTAHKMTDGDLVSSAESTLRAASAAPVKRARVKALACLRRSPWTREENPELEFSYIQHLWCVTLAGNMRTC